MQAARTAKLTTDEAPHANSPSASPDSPKDAQPLDLSDDEEARQVEEWAQQHASSDSASEAPDEEQPQVEQLFVCSGPWGSMHSPTPESLAAYNAAAPEQGKQAVSLFGASCGAKLGAASFAITCTDPLVPCRRQGCLLARAQTQQAA